MTFSWILLIYFAWWIISRKALFISYALLHQELWPTDTHPGQTYCPPRTIIYCPLIGECLLILSSLWYLLNEFFARLSLDFEETAIRISKNYTNPTPPEAGSLTLMEPRDAGGI